MSGRGDARGSRPEKWRMGGHAPDGPQCETRGIAPWQGGIASRRHVRKESRMATKSSGIRRIVLGVDGSESSAAAIKWALRLAKGLGSQVIAVYAVDIPVYLPEPYGLPVQFDPEWRSVPHGEGGRRGRVRDQ